MRSLGLLGLFWLALSVPACADTSEASAEAESDPDTVDAKKQQEGNRKDLVQPLPEGWESYTHSDWLKSLDITDCKTENQGSEPRRKHWITLEERLRLLSLTCEFGAYQDAMLDGEPFLNHALISPYLNIGLLSPLEVCRAAEAAEAT
mgnify:CR=1 FL=1